MLELVRDLPRALVRGLLVALAVGLSFLALGHTFQTLSGTPTPLDVHVLSGALVGAFVVLMSLGEAFVDRRPSIHVVVAAMGLWAAGSTVVALGVVQVGWFTAVRAGGIDAALATLDRPLDHWLALALISALCTTPFAMTSAARLRQGLHNREVSLAAMLTGFVAIVPWFTIPLLYLYGLADFVLARVAKRVSADPRAGP